MKRILSLVLALATVLTLVLPAAAARTQTGYTLTLPQDQNAAIGTTVTIPVSVGHTGGKSTYNAFDMIFNYDAKLLKLTTTAISGMTVTAGNGTVRVQAFGKSCPINDPAFSLTFQILGAGTASIRTESARVDISANAISLDAPEAILLDGETKVTAKGYPVTLPGGFKGEPEAEENKDYTFSIEKEPDYVYTVTATMDGKAVKVVRNSNGTYTIKNVTGKIVVTVHKEPVGSEMRVWITPYVEWDDATVYMIAVTGDPGDKYTYYYREPETKKEKAMYYTEKYDSPVPTFGEKVCVYLQLVKKGETMTLEKAKSRIVVKKGGRSKQEVTADVDGSGKLEEKDVQLVRDIYNGKYDSFKKVSIQKLLRADVSVDGVINMADVAAVACKIP